AAFWTLDSHGVPFSGSLFQDFFRFLVRHLGDLVFVSLQQRLHLLLALVALVFGHLLVFFGHVEVLVGVTADVAAGDLGVFARLIDWLHPLFSLLARPRRQPPADIIFVVFWRHSLVHQA